MNQNSDQQIENNQIKQAMINDFQATQALEDKISDKLFDLSIENIYHRQEYFKHITTLSIAILGFSVVMFTKPPIILGYLITGIILFLALVILLLSHLRESLDEAQKALWGQHEEYRDLLDEKKRIIENYLIKDLTPDEFSKYQKEIMESPIIQEFANKVDDMEKQNKLNATKLNYFGEFVITLFIGGTFFVLLSILNIALQWHILIIFCILILLISFSNLSTVVRNLVNSIVNLLINLRK